MTSTSNRSVNEGVAESSADLIALDAESPAARGATATLNNEVALQSLAPREAGDEVNRFLVCALVMRSAKHIKARAENGDDQVPMAMIVKGLLRAYRQAATEDAGVLAGRKLGLADLRKLNAKVLKEEVVRHRQNCVRTSRERLAHATRLGDDSRIQAEKERLERAMAACERLPVR